tara:strand:+ start:91 stop:315 length:225 start_codon:yes stop_codon:yes gene_type:complete
MSDSINSVFNGFDGAYGSGGSMNNPMYRNICSEGTYEPMTGRSKRRLAERLRRRSASKNRKQVTKKGIFRNKGF